MWISYGHIIHFSRTFFSSFFAIRLGVCAFSTWTTCIKLRSNHIIFVTRTNVRLQQDTFLPYTKRRPTHKADCVEKMATIWKVFESKLFRTMFPHRKEEERHANGECVHIHSHNYCTLQYSNDIFMAANRVLDRKTLVFVNAAQG